MHANLKAGEGLTALLEMLNHGALFALVLLHTTTLYETQNCE